MSHTIMTYYYPGFHANKLMYPGLPNNWCEWELVKKAQPYFDDHYQPRIPVWGYKMETEIESMSLKLRTAKQFGLDSFIFLSYWFDEQEVCEKPLEIALAIADESCVKPCIMWANHDRSYTFPEDGTYAPHRYLRVDYSPKACKAMVALWVEKYFSNPNYFRLPDGKLFFGIYSPEAILANTGSPDFLHALINYIRETVRLQISSDIHIHGCQTRFINDLSILSVGFDSCSDYVALGYSENGREPSIDLPLLYGHLIVQIPEHELLANISEMYRTLNYIAPVPYYPVVTVGRDCSPRVLRYQTVRRGYYSSRPILREFGASHLSARCKIAKSFLRVNHHPENIIFICGWNEWTEGAYLEPDQRHGYTLLETIYTEFTRPWV